MVNQTEYFEERFNKDGKSIFDIAEETIKNDVHLAEQGAFPSSCSSHRDHRQYSVFVKEDISDPNVQYVLIFGLDGKLNKSISYTEWKKEYCPDTNIHQLNICICFRGKRN